MIRYKNNHLAFLDKHKGGKKCKYFTHPHYTNLQSNYCRFRVLDLSEKHCSRNLQLSRRLSTIMLCSLLFQIKFY